MNFFSKYNILLSGIILASGATLIVLIGLTLKGGSKIAVSGEVIKSKSSEHFDFGKSENSPEGSLKDNSGDNSKLTSEGNDFFSDRIDKARLNKKEQGFLPGKQGGQKGNNKTTVMFLGDLMLDRYVRVLADRKGIDWFTQDIKSIFEDNDLAIVNLEGPITSRKSVSVGSKMGERNNYIFTFDPGQTVAFLRRNKLDLINLGNNHLKNQGEEGVRETETVLADNGLSYFGDYTGTEQLSVQRELNGLSFGVVSYNEFDSIGLENVLNRVRELENQVDVVVVYTHWGVEYDQRFSPQQQEKAHQLIDAGADLIVGSHPHVIQPVEVYRDRAIFYSLGNFIFDQYFSEETERGLALKVHFFRADKMTFELLPILINNDGKLSLPEMEDGRRILKTMAENSVINEVRKNELKNGSMSLVIE